MEYTFISPHAPALVFTEIQRISVLQKPLRQFNYFAKINAANRFSDAGKTQNKKFECQPFKKKKLSLNLNIHQKTLDAGM